MTVAKTTKKKIDIAKYRKGSAGFFAWIDDLKPHILNDESKYVPYQVWGNVKDEIAAALDGDYRTIAWVWPRRHGKTLVSAIYIVWRFTCFQNENIGIVAQSEKQSVDTAFKLVRDTLKHTPTFKQMIEAGEIVVQRDRIEFPALNNVIQGYAANPVTLLGQTMTVAQVSELHKARDPEVFRTMKGNTQSVKNGVTLVDSTASTRTGPLGLIYDSWQAQEDPSLYFSHLTYASMEDAIARAPSWVQTADYPLLKRTMLPGSFEAEYLGKFGDGADVLFTEETLRKCRDEYPLDPKRIADGRPYAVGGGLDRAKAFRMSLKGDSTVTAAVAMVQIDDDAHYFVLDCLDIPMSMSGGIRRAFLDYAKDFGMKRLVVEDYNTADIFEWCLQQSEWETESVNPNRQRQQDIFQAVYLAATEGRLHIHPKFDKLLREMGTFTVTHDSESPKFQHATGKHDDAVFAMAWAIYSLRNQVLPAYSIHGIHCKERGPAARLCLLNGGDHEPLCSEHCPSFIKVHELYGKYREKAGCAPMKLPEFARYKLENTGIHSRPR